MVVVGVVIICLGVAIIVFRRPLMRANGKMMRAMSNETVPKAITEQGPGAAILPGLGAIGIGIVIIIRAVTDGYV